MAWIGTIRRICYDSELMEEKSRIILVATIISEGLDAFRFFFEKLYLCRFMEATEISLKSLKSEDMRH